LMYGMLAAPLGAGAWLQLATYFGKPVSTTHSIVGAIVGFGIVAGGTAGVAWGKIGQIVISWFASPLMSGTIAFMVFSLIRHLMINVQNPVRETKRWSPIFIFMVAMILMLVTLFKGLKNMKLDLDLSQALMYSGVVSFIGAAVGAFLIRRVNVPSVSQKDTDFSLASISADLKAMLRSINRIRSLAPKSVEKNVDTIEENLDVLVKKAEQSETQILTREDFRFVERVFAYLQIMSACFVAFAHGANDVANAIGPVSAVVSLAGGGTEALSGQTSVPMWLLGLGSIGIVIGLSTWGWRVIGTIGEQITELTPTRGFSAEFAAATTIVLASRLGIPISTTHTLVGGVMGVGLARGLASMNPRVLRDIFISWVLELPVAAGLSALFFFIIKAAFSSFGG
jgi:inorganic phosphate transporter, PiT family